MGSDVAIREAVLHRLPAGMQITADTIAQLRKTLGMNCTNKQFRRAVESSHYGHDREVVVGRPRLSEYDKGWAIVKPSDCAREFSVQDTVTIVMVWLTEDNAARHLKDWEQLLQALGLVGAWPEEQIATIIRQMEVDELLHLIELPQGGYVIFGAGH
ncbi:MAG TPA: hypothetical protein VL362_00205 [Patescibacteria group bacterium]|nr:hypothetical protein [Patescibacteria group bacterium]